MRPTPDRRPPAAPNLALALAVGMGLAAGGAARAQQDEVVEDEAAVARPGVNNAFEISEHQFDMWVFGNTFRVTTRVVRENGVARVVQTTPTGKDGPRGKLDTILAMKVFEVGRTCNLSDDQREKLTLAGRGDIHRFMGQVEEKRREFETVRRDQQRFGMFYQKLQPLRATFQAGLFNDGSFFQKALRRTLDDDQLARVEETRREHAGYRYRAAVDLLASKLGLALGMTRAQRERFAGVVFDETRPPRSYGTQTFNAVFYQAASVPLEKFTGFLDGPQVAALKRQFTNMRGWEQMLKQNGYIPDTPAGGKE